MARRTDSVTAPLPVAATSIEVVEFIALVRVMAGADGDFAIGSTLPDAIAAQLREGVHFARRVTVVEG